MSSGPLAGRTVLVTREEPEGGPLSAALASLGAEVVLVPALETRPPADPGELRREAARLSDYDWIVFTSARAVAALAAAAGERSGRAPRVAVVGEGTARAARAAGWEPSAIGEPDNLPVAGSTVLFPAADRARPETVARLHELGARVRVVVAYRTLARDGAAAELAAAIAREELDAIALTSPSAVDVLAQAVPLRKIRARLAAIGPTTAQRLREAGARDVVLAPEPTFEALARTLARALAPG